MSFQIKKIPYKDTLAIRHKVMWPNKPLEYVQLPNDANGSHFGLFIKGNLVAVISLFIKNDTVQFRKFATLQRFQGKGFGSILLAHIIDITEKENYQKIWCNARLNKTDFYNKFGFKETNICFTKGGIDYVIMERSF